MANTATNVSTGRPKVGGAVYRAPAGTTLPNDATTALANDYIAMGYISEDGVTNTYDITSETIKEWGGGTVLPLETGVEDKFKMKFIESINPEVLKAVYGDANVTGTALSTGYEVTVDQDEHAAYVWVIEVIMRGGVAKRIIIPNGTVTSVGEIVYKNKEAVGYEVTITAALGTGGFTHKEYIKS